MKFQMKMKSIQVFTWFPKYLEEGEMIETPYMGGPTEFNATLPTVGRHKNGREG